MPEPAALAALRAASLCGPVACVDLETTGGLAAHDRIIEVGIVLLEAGAIVEQWSTLVRPGVRIPPSIAAFTGIDDGMVADAPTFVDVRYDVLRRLEGRLFVAHNARFDYGFLRSEFRRHGVRFSAPVLCTVRLSRTLYAEHPRHNLDTLIERLGLTCAARHRALGDAQVLPALLAAMESERGVSIVDEAVTTVLREARLPPQLPAELADDLPEGAGVYLLRDVAGTLLYVGKGRNLRSRVFEHFTGGQRSGKAATIASETRQVEWIETGGELGALLLESKLLQEHAPRGNRRPRQADGDCVVRLEHDGAGLVPRVVALADAFFDPDAVVFGPFRSARDAGRAIEGKAREAGLCLKTLGLEAGEGSCVAYQFGKCRGACVGREPRVLHDARLQLTLASLKLKPWPFAGPVGIREPAPGGHGNQLHVLDRWRHLGTARDEGEIADVLERARAADGRFDADSYRIINRALADVRPRDLMILPPTTERP